MYNLVGGSGRVGSGPCFNGSGRAGSWNCDPRTTLGMTNYRICGPICSDADHIRPHRTIWDRIGPHRNSSDHAGSKLSPWTSKWPHRIGPIHTSCVRVLITQTQSITLRPNRPMRRVIFLKTDSNLYSWPYPTHATGSLEVPGAQFKPDAVRCGSDAVICHTAPGRKFTVDAGWSAL